jgi:hypothetical protein
MSAEQLSHRRVTAVLTSRATRACAAKQASLSLSNCHLPTIEKGAEPGRPGIWQLPLYCRK